MPINSNIPGDSDDPVARLVADGRYADAAETAWRAGDPLRAADLYERIWEFQLAARCAREGGDLPRALRAAVDARDEALIAELLGALDARGDEGRRQAMEALAVRRRFGEAGAMAERVGELERAVEYYRQAGRDLDAARLLEQLGRDREAGRLLERLVSLDEEGPELGEARLRLGLLLARRLRHREAARHLQEAARHEATRPRALRALVVAMASLGMRDAARDVLLEARASDPSLPLELDAFLRGERDAHAPPVAERDADVVAGRYRLEKLLGSGGAGRVFRAHDEVGGRTIALKMLTVAAARGAAAYERFVREARIASALRHPNLVEVYDFSAEQGYLVMEYMPGGSLADRQEEGRLTAPAVRRVALNVLAGLELAHQRGIIHRDVKPANIFFDARGVAKLGDFGVAHLLDLGQTQTGGLIGTLAYMAPEQITGAPLTIAADLYGLGITLFRALTGRLPFLGPDFVAQHLGEEPPAPSAVAPGVAPSWDPIIARLLAKNPAERYESIEALRRDLEQVDLGEAAQPRPLVLPRSVPPRRRSAESSSSLPAQREDVEDAEAPRYQYETAIGRSANARLSRALDAALDRTVIIERYDEPLDEASEQRLYAMARGGGPFLQHALAYDRAGGVAVFEAPSGVPLAEAYADAPPSPREAARLLKRLARAVAPLHEATHAHGALGPTTILVEDQGIPTVLTSGLGPVTGDPRPRDDVATIVGILAGVTRVEPSHEALVDALAPGLSPAERAALLALTPAGTGEELYAFADALEVAHLTRTRANASPSGSP